MLKSSGRMYSSISSWASSAVWGEVVVLEAAGADVEGAEEDEEEEVEAGSGFASSSISSSLPILRRGTRCVCWKYERRLQYLETYASSWRARRTSSSRGMAARMVGPAGLPLREE